MVDFAFFRSRSFLGANIVAFIVSFAMLAMFFFLALYMQNIRDYSPLEAGIRFLPSTALVIVMGPLAGRLADRVGPRPLMTFGLVLVSGALFWQSHLTVSSGYARAAARLHADGHRHRLRDVADEHRRDELRRADQGGRGLGHPLAEPHGRRHLRRGRHGRAGEQPRRLEDRELLPRVPAGARARSDRKPRLGRRPARRAPTGASPPRHEAYVYALQYGLRVGAAVALLGAVLAWVLVASRAQAMVPGGVHAEPRRAEAPEAAAAEAVQRGSRAACGRGRKRSGPGAPAGSGQGRIAPSGWRALDQREVQRHRGYRPETSLRG